MTKLFLSALAAVTLSSNAMAATGAPGPVHGLAAPAVVMPVPASPRLALRFALALERAEEASEADPRSAIRTEIRALRAVEASEGEAVARATGSALRRQ
ncbi:hypothetical protein [Litorisediminicola beolgyonensis]|uniref:Uncharacterized protein n=1 Tax=Litorisediminicola beolgyonensis TaxID=1173614 RepID=A0ABW3ZLM2_9RHOB